MRKNIAFAISTILACVLCLFFVGSYVLSLQNTADFFSSSTKYHGEGFSEYRVFVEGNVDDAKLSNFLNAQFTVLESSQKNEERVRYLVSVRSKNLIDIERQMHSLKEMSPDAIWKIVF